MRKLLSLVIPVYNEQENITALYQAIIAAWQELFGKGYDYEIIFVDDGSLDQSARVLEKLTNSDSQVKWIEFSRNFGKEIAVTAGLHHAQGEAAIILDADLQHPPHLIPEFIEKWQNGAEVVVGARKVKPREKLLRSLGSSMFYQAMRLISEGNINLYATDYRLLDKKVIREFRRFSERRRVTRGLIDWLGFKKDYVYFEAPPRKAGRSTYSLRRLASLGLSGFISHSLFPLRFAGYLGLGITFFASLLGLFILVNQYLLNDPLRLGFSNLGLLAVFMLFLIGIVLICLGLIALYIANIHNEVINRPMYVIRRSKNIQ